MTGLRLDQNEHCKINFGDCHQVCDDTNDTQRAQTVRAICTGSGGNLQGGCKCVNLNTGEKIA